MGETVMKNQETSEEEKTVEQKVDEIHSMLLDMKRTFDKLQKRFPLLRIGL